MDETAYTRLVRDIEIAKGKLNSHERECTQRYKNIEDTMVEVKNDVAAILAKVDGQALAANKWVLGVAAAIILLLLGALGWTGGQLYDIEPTRVHSQAPIK